MEEIITFIRQYSNWETEIHESYNVQYNNGQKFIQSAQNHNHPSLVTPFKNAVEYVGGSKLGRKQLFWAYQGDDLYSAFIATLMWGGDFRHYSQKFEAGKDVISSKLRHVKELMTNGEVDGAFSSMLNSQANYIKGVGMTYLTKILYFLGDGNNALVFDSVMRDVYYHIFNDFDEEKNYPSRGQEWADYSDYVAKMNKLKEHFSDGYKRVCDEELTAGHIEAFIFQHRSELPR